MATVKLGMLVTEIRGSIGGTTFRNSGSTLVMQNKGMGASKNSTLQNKRVNQMAQIIRSWSALSPVAQSNWADLAAEYPQLDKFGVSKILKPREMFVKLTNATNVVGLGAPDPTAANNTIEFYTWSSFTISLSGTAVIPTTTIPANVYALLQFQQIRNIAQAVQFTRRKFDYAALPTTSNTIDIKAALIAKYPSLKVGDYVRVFGLYQNLYGFRTANTSQNIEVVA